METLRYGMQVYSKTFEAGGGKFIFRESCSSGVFIVPLCPPIQKVDKWDLKPGCQAHWPGSWKDPTAENPVPTLVGKAVPVWNLKKDSENSHKPTDEYRPICKAGKVFPIAKDISRLPLDEAEKCKAACQAEQNCGCATFDDDERVLNKCILSEGGFLKRMLVTGMDENSEKFAIWSKRRSVAMSSCSGGSPTMLYVQDPLDPFMDRVRNSIGLRLGGGARQREIPSPKLNDCTEREVGFLEREFGINY